MSAGLVNGLLAAGEQNANRDEQKYSHRDLGYVW